jgi:thioredoxin-dependent peroxiredoxin
MPMIAEGAKAPAFTMTNQDGAAVSLDKFAGKYVLLWWYPKADTPG